MYKAGLTIEDGIMDRVKLIQKKRNRSGRGCF